VTRKERIAELERENEELRRQGEERARESSTLQEQVERLRKQNATLRIRLDAWKRGLCERRKRRTSRPERRTGGAPAKRPGRKAGHVGAKRRIPDRIDDERHYGPPVRCTCGGVVEPTAEVRSTVVQDIPKVALENVRHVAHLGRCSTCKKKVSVRLPGDVGMGQTVVGASVGPNLQAMAVGLRFEQKVALGKIGAFMGQWFGLSITAGGLSHMVTRLRKRSRGSYEEIASDVRGSAVVGGDETGLRQNGDSGWCWLLRTARASLFHVDRSRGGHVFAQMLGRGFIGVLVTDFYSVYTGRTDVKHGYCGAHLILETKKVAELHPSPVTGEFRDRVRAFYKAGEQAQKSGNVGAQRGLRVRFGLLANSPAYAAFPDILRLQKRMRVHKVGITRFLGDAAVPWHNNHSEGDIRDIARYRAVSGGTRSDDGSKNLGHWMSITQTRRKNRLPLGPFVVGVYNAHLHGTSPPSVFA
jgi:transposase